MLRQRSLKTSPDFFWTPSHLLFPVQNHTRNSPRIDWRNLPLFYDFSFINSAVDSSENPQVFLKKDAMSCDAMQFPRWCHSTVRDIPSFQQTIVWDSDLLNVISSYIQYEVTKCSSIRLRQRSQWVNSPFIESGGPTHVYLRFWWHQNVRILKTQYFLAKLCIFTTKYRTEVSAK